VGPSWAGRFAHDIGANAFINVSGTGRRAADLIRTQVPLVLEYKPSYALISVGGNDVLRRKFDPVMVGRQLREAATALIAIDCQVVVLGLPDPRRYLPLPRVLVEILSDRADLVNCALQACMQDFIRDRHITWIDTWGDSNSSASQHWHIDRMHPSAAGHQYLADVARRHVGL
jgi:lysophospholipase L1-like esterase